MDFARTHWRGYLKSWGEEDNFFESIDKLVDEQLVYPLCNIIKKHCPSFKDKVVCLIEGNHHYKYGSGPKMGQTTTEEMCRVLGVEYGGLATWARLTIYRSKGTKKFGTGRNINCLLHHGESAGQYVTSALSKLERQVVSGWRGIDVILSSHNHMLGHIVSQQIGVPYRGKMRLAEYPLLMAKTGCFKKSYTNEPERNSYEERRLFKPAARGWFECSAQMRNTFIKKKPCEKLVFTNFNC